MRGERPHFARKSLKKSRSTNFKNLNKFLTIVSLVTEIERKVIFYILYFILYIFYILYFISTLIYLVKSKFATEMVYLVSFLSNLV